MTDPRPDRPDRLVFPCGAFHAVDANRWEKDVRSNGRVRLVVVDTEKGCTAPSLDDKPAPCRFFCPKRRYRKAIRAMSDGPDPFAPRTVVLCSGVLVRAEALAAKASNPGVSS